MQSTEPFVDIHCHFLPGIDDGAKSWAESLQMARIALEEGTGTIVVTPHQLGNFAHIRGDQIRRAARELQQYYDAHGVSLHVLPGADVRVQIDLIDQLRGDDVLTLADRGKHVLLELPHELYFSLDKCLEGLARESLTGILSHPERNQGLLRKPEIVGRLVERGCLMQITAGSLFGAFGARCQAFAERLVRAGWVHFVATDAHGAKARRPLMRRAFQRLTEMIGESGAYDLCCRNPALVARGYAVAPHLNPPQPPRGGWLAGVMFGRFAPGRAA